MKNFRLLRADEIECRISTVKQDGVSLLLYKDARCDMNILDETVGMENWQRKHELIDGQLFCSVGIRTASGDWIWKQDVGVESYTEKEKGRASDAFKRACFNLGIGRELYTAPFIWVPSVAKGGCAKISQKGTSWTCYDRFTVGKIRYAEDESISYLEIMCGDRVAFRKGYTDTRETIEGAKVAALRQVLKENGIEEEYVLQVYKVSCIEEISEKQHLNIIKHMDQVKAGCEEWKAKAV